VSEQLRTAREVAELLGVSTGALLRWTRAGKVPGAVKLPSGAVRYRPKALETWLDEQTMAGDAARGVSPTQDATRQEDGNLPRSPTRLRRTRSTNRGGT
jgi:predicted DNA-binding transcriptional regulator AlpA